MNCPICHAANPDDARVCASCGSPLRPSADSAERLAPGTALQQGNYIIQRVLGQGGFGITYLATDTKLSRDVAIKEFYPAGSFREGENVRPTGAIEPAEFEATLQSFLEEARTLARFRHPGIVNVYTVFEENNTAYMVMELLHAKNLGDLVRERGQPLKEEVALDFMRQVGDALETVHGAGLLHRDIKPENLMLCDDRRIVLIDFGTARDFASGLTRGHTVVVTPGYAPLEQYAHQAQRGAFTDIYSLAATLFFLLTAQAPPAATDRAAGVELMSPRELNPTVSQNVGDAVLWAMSLKVDVRPRSVRDFLDVLNRRPVIVPAPTPSLAPPKPRDASQGMLIATPVANVLHLHAGNTTPGQLELLWPHQCACCGSRPDTKKPIVFERVGPPELRQDWNVPYCHACIKKLEKPKVDWMAAAVLVFADLSGLLIAYLVSAIDRVWWPIALWILINLASLWSLLREQFGQTETLRYWNARAPVRCVKVFRDSTGIVYELQIDNHTYLTAFEQVNNSRDPLGHLT